MATTETSEYPADWTPIATRSRHDLRWTPLPRAPMSTSQAETLRSAGHLLTRTPKQRGLSVYQIKRA